jgi:hypothetical protein
MTIDTSGYVGIGITAPIKPFHVSSEAWPQSIIGNSSYSVVAGNNSGVATLGGSTSSLTAWSKLHINPGADVSICNDSGNVGIGKSDPLVKLDVVGEIRGVGSIVSWGDANNYLAFDYNGNMRRVYQGNSGSGLHFTISSIIPLNYDGGFGNGTVNFGATLNRWSNIFCNVINYSTGSLGSDDRLKHNEEPVLNALSTINKLNVKLYDKTYDMLDADYMGDLTDHEHFKEVGVIAQDILEIPELKDFVKIPEDIEKEPYGVNYNCIFSVGLKAIQELSVENENMKKENENMKKENENMKKEILELKENQQKIIQKLNELISPDGWFKNSI